MAADNEMTLRVAQQGQILEEYRANIFNLELKVNLLLKMIEEKGIMVSGEFDNRWPLYLKNDIGVVGQDGKMEGCLKITKYGEK